MAQANRQAIRAADAAEEEGRIPTNLRSLLVLEALSESAEALTPTEIGRRVGLPKQTAHRLCSTLLKEGFLTRAAGGKGLRPGRRARLMANGLTQHGGEMTARRQILLRVAETVQETVNFAQPREDGMIYIDRVETDWAFRIQLPIGSTVPFHCTASGKTYLASLPPARRARVVRALTLKRWTPKSHVTPESLLEDLAAIAKRGYALDDEELMEGMVALSVPVTDPNGRYAASLAFHGPVPRLTIDIALRHLPMMRREARALSAALFG